MHAPITWLTGIEREGVLRELSKPKYYEGQLRAIMEERLRKAAIANDAYSVEHLVRLLYTVTSICEGKLLVNHPDYLGTPDEVMKRM